MSHPEIVYIDEELQDLIPGFIQHRYENLAALNAALLSLDWQRIQTIGHQMKGSGHTYGLDYISELGSHIETAAKARDKAPVQEAVAGLQHFMDHLKIEFVTQSESD